MIERIETENDAVEFMKRVKFALRYNSTPGLPLPSMYAAAADKRRAIEIIHEAAGPIIPKKFASMFKLCFKPEERISK